MKKTFALVLAFLLLFGSMSSFADGESSDKQVKNMVVVGDFTATGYGSDISTVPSFAHISAEKLGLKYKESSFYFGSDSLTLDTLDAALGEDVIGQISKADTVVVSVGNGDLQKAILPKISAALGLGETFSPSDTVNALATLPEEKLEGAISALKTIYGDNKESFEALTKSIGEKCGEAAKKIKTASPNAQIFFVGVYDPFADMPNYTLVNTLRSELTSKLVSNINETLADTGKSEGFHVLNTASEFSGRKQTCVAADGSYFYLTEFGHTVLADALVYEITNVYNAINGGSDTPNDPTDVWLYFSIALAAVLACVPVIVFVAKKSKK
ncbi:MAG: hypothetical protein E7626_04880 [Ruminococcaceae bacterium]|nr:hypothetical protein [Oscillospiraceae bacterium]